MAIDTKTQFEEFATLMNQMRTVNDETKTQSAESKTIIERMNARLDELELAQKRPNIAGAKIVMVNEEEHKTFNRIIRRGFQDLQPEERKIMKSWEPGAEAKAMLLGDDTSGGFFATVDFIAEVIKNIVLMSPVRQYATIKTTSHESAEVGVRTGTPSATWGTEQASMVQTATTYGKKAIVAHKLTALSLINLQDLEDSAINLEEQLAEDFAEEFGRAEGAAFINGNGITQPEGILTRSDVTSYNSGDTNLLTGDGLVTFYHALKSPYVVGSYWGLNRQTLGAVRILKDNQGRYLLQPGIAQGNPSTILDSPYIEMPDLPAVAANAYPVIFGNIKKAYTILDRIGMSMQRLDQLYSAQDAVGFKARKRVGGQVVLSEAIIKLKIHS